MCQITERGVHAVGNVRERQARLLDSGRADLAVWRYLHQDFLSDRGFCLEAVQGNGLCLKYAPSTFATNKSFVLDAVREDPRTMEYAEHEIRTNFIFCLRACTINPEVARAPRAAGQSRGDTSGHPKPCTGSVRKRNHRAFVQTRGVGQYFCCLEVS